MQILASRRTAGRGGMEHSSAARGPERAGLERRGELSGTRWAASRAQCEESVGGEWAWVNWENLEGMIAS